MACLLSGTPVNSLVDLTAAVNAAAPHHSAEFEMSRDGGRVLAARRRRRVPARDIFQNKSGAAKQIRPGVNRASRRFLERSRALTSPPQFRLRGDYAAAFVLLTTVEVVFALASVLAKICSAGLSASVTRLV